jgi:type IV pilus assembly protein PilA
MQKNTACQSPSPQADRNNGGNRARGFTLIELMIVIAIIAIILTLALPVYTNYTIRAKVGEALSVGAAAKTATSSSCVEDPTMTGLNNTRVGYLFQPSPFINDIVVQGDCSAPEIVLTTRNTGASPDIIVTLVGDFLPESGSVKWRCSTSNSFIYVPENCRNT